MRRIAATCIFLALTVLISGCMTFHYETKFSDKYLAAKAGSPEKSIKIPTEIVQNHLKNLWEMFWESENTIYLVMRDELDARGLTFAYSKPDYGVYVVDLEKGETTRLSDAEREDFIFRLKNRFKYFETEPESTTGKIGKALSKGLYILEMAKLKPKSGEDKRLFEGQLRYGDVSVDISYDWTQRHEPTAARGTQMESKMKIKNNLTNKTQSLSACGVTEREFRKTQLSPDGSYYFLCGGKLLKTDEEALLPIFIVGKMEGKGHEDKIKGRQIVHKYGEEFYTQFLVPVAQLSPKWDRIAILTLWAYDKSNFGANIEFYPADFYLKKQEPVK